MNFDQLKTSWKAGIATPPDGPDMDRVAHQVRANARRYRREALLRRIFGSTAFVLTLAVLGVVAVLPDVWPGMRVAIGVWSASILACAAGLWRIRHSHRLPPDAPLTGHLQACLEGMRREIAYFHALRWTFWLPFGIGFAFAMAWRAPDAGGVSLFLVLATTALWIWGFVQGPRHVPGRLEPQAAQLERMLHDMRTEDQTTGDRS